MEFESDSEKLYNAFVNVVRHGKNNNTYKFALAKFLLDYSKEHDKVKVNVKYKDIAKKFFDYYWLQECRYRLRQGPKNQVPLVIKIIREEFDEENYPYRLNKIKLKHSSKIKRCILNITNNCFDDVIPRLEDDAEHCFGKPRKAQSKKRIFYDYHAIEYRDSANNKRVDSKGGVRLNPYLINMLKENNDTLFIVVVFEWIKFLEKRNVGIPNLVEKIANNELMPRDQRKFIEYLEGLTDRCFYCNNKLKSGKNTHVDHFLPYDYVGTTELWNLVLACQKCNCKKSNSLPPESFVKKLEIRNEEHRNKKDELGMSLKTLWNENEFKQYYSNAMSYRFPTWCGPAQNDPA
ncbi:MAG: HNH endonuclease [Thaumarchaeota archaeon]|nr:HNH endonuclease [Nitrososphaerota archaeon]